MKNQNFEAKLPEGYKTALHINAKSPKFGIIFNLIALVVLVVVMVVAIIPTRSGMKATVVDETPLLLVWGVLLVAMVAYVVLHELVHGVAYKALTGQKLTFGMSWSCAFCGVPDIYVYRRTALIAVAAPLLIFTLILVPLIVWLYSVNVIYYFAAAFLFGLHLGGCSGDIYVLLLLLFKFRDKRTLIKDSGPEQFFCVPEA